MWWLIQNIIFSICLIVIVHYLYIYFETTLTSPKVKDLIHSPKQEYKLLLESINKKVDAPSYLPPPMPIPTPPSLSLPLAPTETLGINIAANDMKADLKDYLREIGFNANNSNISHHQPS
jgi:hypothetical protein